MQEVFASNPVGFAGIHAVVPAIATLAEAKPQQTLWTRFISAYSAEEAEGSWAALYRVRPGATLAAGAADGIFCLSLPFVSARARFSESLPIRLSRPAFVATLNSARPIRWSSPASKPMSACW